MAPGRLRRLLTAQAEVRRVAAAGLSLTPALLAHWNGIARGVAVTGFHSGPAYAKGGRERYGPDVRRADDADGAAALARLIHGVAAAAHRRRSRRFGATGHS